jgi:hypothetical protein
VNACGERSVGVSTRLWIVGNVAHAICIPHLAGSLKHRSSLKTSHRRNPNPGLAGRPEPVRPRSLRGGAGIRASSSRRFARALLDARPRCRAGTWLGCDRLRAEHGGAHDVLEDTDWTTDDLAEASVDATVLEAVEALTRRPAEKDETFVARICATPGDVGVIAQRVKLADLTVILAKAATDQERERFERDLPLVRSAVERS